MVLVRNTAIYQTDSEPDADRLIAKENDAQDSEGFDLTKAIKEKKIRKATKTRDEEVFFRVTIQKDYPQ